MVVEGQAQRVTDRARLERLAKAWATKWDGFWQYEASDEGLRQTDPTSDPDEAGTVDGVVYAVEPSKILAFGKRLSDKLYVSYEAGLGAVASNLVKLDYSLSRRWSLRAETGTSSGWGLFYRFSWD